MMHSLKAGTTSGTGRRFVGLIVMASCAAAGIGIAVPVDAAIVTWNVAGSGNWDTTSSNWTGGSPDASKFVTGDSATFSNTAGGTITLSGTIDPQDVTVSATSGTYTFTGGDLDNGRYLTKQNGGDLVLENKNIFTSNIQVWAGSLEVSSGGSLTTSSGYLQVRGGATASIAGTVTLTGGAELLTQNTTGTATIDILSGGSVSVSSTGAIIGQNTGDHNGVLNVSGTYSQNKGYALIGNQVSSATGTLNVNNGGLVTFDTGMNNSSGSGANNATGVVLGRNGATGTINLESGGTLETAKNIIRGNGTGNFNFNGGTLKALANSSNTGLDVSTTTVNSGGAIVDTNGFNFLITDNLAAGTGSGGLTKQGTGTLTLAGVGAYTGNTSITGGTLKLASTGSINTTPTITVGSGATYDVSSVSGYTLGAAQTLAGIGTVAGDVTLAAGADLSPGTSPGTLTFTGNLSVGGSNTGDLKFDLGTSSDLIDLTAGTLTIGSSLGFNDFAFTAGSGFGPGVYKLFQTTQTISGTLDSGDLTGTVGGLGATLSLAANGYGADRDLILTVVPEPGTFAMLLFGSVMLWAVRRKRA